MHKFEHKKIIEEVIRIDAVPADNDEFSEWLKADAQLNFLTENSQSDELALYVSGPYSFVRSVLVPLAAVSPPDVDDLLGWNFGGSDYRSSYTQYGDSRQINVEHGVTGSGTRTLEGAQQIIFHRNFDGWLGEDRNYVEALQEFTHLSGIHWRPEENAYCKFDAEGDVFQVLSVSLRGSNKDDVSLVTVARDILDDYLAAGKFALVRLFDFTLLRQHGFADWGDGGEEQGSHGKAIHFRRCMNSPHAAYTRGFEIVVPREGYDGKHNAIVNRWSGKQHKEYVIFRAWDWRNKKLTNISTDPTVTTNYFDMAKNDLPHELSPAFFGAEVLAKYKADRDKYTIETRRIHCRATWTLDGYDINEAGQIHAYICYLRNLPYKEQLHWLSHNEEPKALLSKRAITTDFRGEFTDEIDPLDEVKSRLRRWRDRELDWWRPTSDNIFDRVTTPVSKNRDEWAEAFMDLSKLVIEGFRTKSIRALLRSQVIKFEKDEGTIRLLERFWEHHDPVIAGRFEAMRTVQKIRSKAKGHSGSSEAMELANNALKKHGGYRQHFEHICRELDEELEIVFDAFNVKS